MMEQCGACLKYLLFIFNFILWLFGCALLSVGIWMRTDDTASHYVQRMTEKVDPEFQIDYSMIGESDVTNTLSVLLIIFGLVIIAVTFIGCCGAIRDNTCLLGVFSVCLVAAMIALVSIGVWALVKRSSDLSAHTGDLKKKTYGDVERAVKEYHTNDNAKDFMDNIQHKFKCCGGSHSHNDYPVDGIPDSCLPEYHQRRCTTRYYNFVTAEIEEFLRDRYKVVGAVAIAIAVCMMLGVILSLLVYCSVRRSSSVRVN